jgi:hypothetical protein
MPKRQTKTANVPVHKKSKELDAEQVDTNGDHQARTCFVPQTELGHRLWRIRQRILASGQPLLDWEGIESELRERTGEATPWA